MTTEYIRYVTVTAWDALMKAGIFLMILNILGSIMMLISVIACIFSGYTYLKNGKDLFKDR